MSAAAFPIDTETFPVTLERCIDHVKQIVKKDPSLVVGGPEAFQDQSGTPYRKQVIRVAFEELGMNVPCKMLPIPTPEELTDYCLAFMKGKKRMSVAGWQDQEGMWLRKSVISNIIQLGRCTLEEKVEPVQCVPSRLSLKWKAVENARIAEARAQRNVEIDLHMRTALIVENVQTASVALRGYMSALHALAVALRIEMQDAGKRQEAITAILGAIPVAFELTGNADDLEYLVDAADDTPDAADDTPDLPDGH